jgi:Rnl2 family RNA ligase
MPFIKYSEIDNSYQTKEMNYWLEKFPQLADETYVIEEKVDGSNISFIFEPNGSFHLAKRSSLIEPDENFYNIQSVALKEYNDIISVVQSFARSTGSSVNLYGELYGKGIQNRINYGDGKYITFFDATIDGKILRRIEIEDLVSSLNIEDVLMPHFGLVKGLYNALEFDVEKRPSLIYPEGGDFIEGVVIKPYHSLDYIENERFYFKKKAEAFKERSAKKHKEPKSVDSKLVELQSTFREYINENRVLSAFSKCGEINKAEDIGKYIKIVLEDAKKDFVEDYDVSDLDKKELRFIYNVSKDVVEILKKYL